METETGYAVATEMYRQLEDVGITDQVVMEVAVSTGVSRKVRFQHQYLCGSLLDIFSQNPLVGFINRVHRSIFSSPHNSPKSPTPLQNTLLVSRPDVSGAMVMWPPCRKMTNL